VAGGVLLAWGWTQLRAGPRAAARPRDASNLFANGDFEAGRPPWHDRRAPSRRFWHGFDLRTDAAAHGRASALLHLAADESTPKEALSIVGVVQEVRVPYSYDAETKQEVQELPEIIAGQYRVETWSKRTPKQYIQFVVILWGSDQGSDVTNIQIRYLLAGAPAPPLNLMNAKYIVLDPAEPRVGSWISFARSLRKDWLEQWGSLPHHFEFLRILFEVRYDEAPDLPAGPLGDVSFDDLYLGPADAFLAGP
jgi:hypothetical protein